GQGLEGVSVSIKGSQQRTVTDANGEYRIDGASAESILVFSSVGFLSQEVTVGNQTVIHIALLADVRAIDEIVVVGYGEQRKVTLAGAVSSIGADDIVVTKNENIQNALTGRL